METIHLLGFQGRVNKVRGRLHRGNGLAYPDGLGHENIDGDCSRDGCHHVLVFPPTLPRLDDLVAFFIRGDHIVPDHLFPNLQDPLACFHLIPSSVKKPDDFAVQW